MIVNFYYFGFSCVAVILYRAIVFYYGVAKIERKSLKWKFIFSFFEIIFHL